MPKERLVIATTVPETLDTILRYQPAYLNDFFDVTLVTSSGKEVDRILATEGLPTHQIDMKRGISPFHDVVSIVRMVLLLRKIRPHIVQSYTPKAGLVCMLAAWLCRIPVRVHTFTGLIFPTEKGFRKRILIAVDRVLCACATHIVPEGQGVRNDLIKFDITRKNMAVIGHGNIAGVDLDFFSPDAPGVEGAAAALHAEYGIGKDDFVFCFVGRLNKDKGLNELLEAFGRQPVNTRLLLVGALDESASIAPETLRVLHEHPRMHWLGFQSDVRPALKVAHVLVLPSYREGFPNVVLQAGAMGLPVIATNINGSNEIIEEGLNGWLVPARDHEALAAAMVNARQQSDDTYLRMGRQARARIAERFERKRHWARMRDFYQELASKA